MNVKLVLNYDYKKYSLGLILKLKKKIDFLFRLKTNNYSFKTFF